MKEGKIILPIWLEHVHAYQDPTSFYNIFALNWGNPIRLILVVFFLLFYLFICFFHFVIKDSAFL